MFIFDLNTIRALEQELFTQTNPDVKDGLQYEWDAAWDATTRLCRVKMRFRYCCRRVLRGVRGDSYAERVYATGD